MEEPKKFTAMVDQDVRHGVLYNLGKLEKVLPSPAPVGWLCPVICLCQSLAKSQWKENAHKRQANREGPMSSEKAVFWGLCFEAHLLCGSILYYERGRGES